MSGALSNKGRLIAVDGVDAAAVLAAARTALAASASRDQTARGGISRWDASGIFQDLAVAEEEAGAASPRTLLLLYAADLAFRLRWQVRPALAEGRTVVVAPYVETAVAFGRAAGLAGNWLENLFRFAPRSSERHLVSERGNAGKGVRDGFVGFASAHAAPSGKERARQRLIDRTAARLRDGAKRTRPKRKAARRVEST